MYIKRLICVGKYGLLKLNMDNWIQEYDILKRIIGDIKDILSKITWVKLSKS